MAETCPTCKSFYRKGRLCAAIGGEGSPHEAFRHFCVQCTDHWHDAKEEKMEYYGHCPKCGELLGFGHLPEKCDKVPAQATREQLEAALESEEFYSLMQAYRFAPLANQSAVIRSFAAVKQFIRERLLGGK